MVFAKKGPEPKSPWSFRSLYLFIIWGLLALLLIVNGAYESRRAQKNLYRMLADEGAVLTAGLEQSVQASFANLTAAETIPGANLFFASQLNLLELEDSVLDFILEEALRIDQEIGKGTALGEEVRQIAKASHLSDLKLILDLPPSEKPKPSAANRPFYQSLLEGKAAFAIRRAEKKETGQTDHLAIAVRRKAGPGILALAADDADLRFLRRRVILQGLIEEWKGKGDTRYITLEGDDGETWADTDPAKIGKKDESRSVRKNAAGGGETAYPTRELPGVLEVAREIALDRGTRGILRVGLSTEKVEQILDADRRNIVLFSLLLLILGGIAVALIYRLESRHLARVRTMEEKVHQSEKLSSLAHLAAGVAHEIRNPLNAIGMAIQRLQREFVPERADMQGEYRRFTDLLRGEVTRVNEIIEQFLFFARPARLQLGATDLAAVLRDLLLLCRENAEQKKISLEEDIEPNLPSLMMDRRRIGEALMNLINNGIQAMPHGGRLRLSARIEGKMAIVRIADTGEGIPEENLNKIFDYYFTTKEKGTGLGLALAYKIVQEHGGEIGVESAIGKGTTFLVRLPAGGESA